MAQVRFTPDEAPAPSRVRFRPDDAGGDPSGRATVAPAMPVQEFVVGALEGVGIDPASPILGTARNLWDAGKTLLTTDPRETVPAILKEIVMAPVRAGREMVEGTLEGDVNKVAHGTGALAGMVGSVLAPTPKGQQAIVRGARATGAAGERAVVRSGQAAKAVAAKGAEVALGRPSTPVRAMVQAIKPKNSNVGFADDLLRAMPEVKAVESQLGHAISGLDDLQAAIPLAKQAVRAQYDAVAGPQRLRQISGDSVAQAIESTIPAKVRLQDPARAAEVANQAKTYRQAFSLETLEEFLSTTNAQLDAYYAKFPAARNVAKRANPETAALVAEAGALRKLIYNSFDIEGGGSGPRELQKRYGALMNLERETARRVNVANRQQPDSLTQQIGKLQAGFEVAKGVARFPFSPRAAVVENFGPALLGRKIPDFIRERNSADALIRGAFERWTVKPHPVEVKPVNVAGYLGTGALVTPPPTPEAYVRGIPAEYARRPIRGLLPEPQPPRRTLVTPAPEREAYVRGIPAEWGKHVKARMSAESLGQVGKALDPVREAIDDATLMRMKAIQQEIQGGAVGEMTGRTVGFRDPVTGRIEEGGRRVRGVKAAYPELKGFQESPGRLAKAIEVDGNNPLYKKIEASVRELVVNEQTDAIAEALSRAGDVEFGFGANARTFTQWRETIRKALEAKKRK